MTPLDRFNVLTTTPKGATCLLNVILDDYGVVDLLNCFFPNMNDDEQQRLLDQAHERLLTPSRRPRLDTEFIYNGETKTLREWCVLNSLPCDTVKKRVQNGWSFDKAITTPIRHAISVPEPAAYNR